jgi:hypothetical protein
MACDGRGGEVTYPGGAEKEGESKDGDCGRNTMAFTQAVIVGF